MLVSAFYYHARKTIVEKDVTMNEIIESMKTEHLTAERDLLEEPWEKLIVLKSSNV